MNASRYIFLVLALSFIVAFPYEASTKEIPFYITCDTTTDCPQKNIRNVGPLVIVCNGPYSRWSWPSPQPTFGAIHEKFYSAKETIFSPYGKWTCCTNPSPSSNGQLTPFCSPDLGQLITAKVSFNLTKSDSEVSLTMTGTGLSGSLTVNLASDSQTITAKATLGDDNNNKRRERDTWNFNGTGGILF